ncbi:MAG: hypothetical protein ACR2QL_04185 [Woeseiaceae bacterium]
MSVYTNLSLVLIAGVASLSFQTSHAQTNAELQARISELEERLLAMEELVANNTVLRLDGYLSLDDSNPERPTALFAGTNVQVVNGVGSTPTINGLGNVIIGYDETKLPSPHGRNQYVCSEGSAFSVGSILTKEDCVGQGFDWYLNHKSGSHNLVVGGWHNYSQFGGLVVGSGNTINGRYATVTGGAGNTASGNYSSVSGGQLNAARGDASSVTGGHFNVARVWLSSVNGGSENIATGVLSTVSGGQQNEAIDHFTTIVGGHRNEARKGSTVSGGSHNRAIGRWSSISGGNGNVTRGDESHISGGENNTARGDYSSISGGSNRDATGESDWVAGSLFQDN